MRRNIIKELRGNLWVALIDAICVNLAFIVSLLLRYYVNSSFMSSAKKFIGYYGQVAPLYTVMCIVIFAEFGLYHGMWKNARFNDLNRIAGANIFVLLIYIIISSIFGIRVPFNVCIVAGLLQFLAVTIVRYATRFIRLEKSKIAKRKNKTKNVMIVGEELKGRNMIKFLSTDPQYKPAVILGSSSGEHIYNVPVVKNDDYMAVITSYDIGCVIIVSKSYDEDKRKELENICETKGIEFLDYSGSPLELLANIPMFTLIKMTIQQLKWDLLYDWE